MKIKESDLVLFEKLQIKNVIDLALLFPKKIDNFTLTQVPKENENCTQKVKISSVNFRPNQLFGLAYCEAWKQTVRFVFFHPSKWHTMICKLGQEILFNAKITLFNDMWQFSNPRIITQNIGFYPKYNIQGIKDSEIQRLIQSYVTFENLQQSGLEQKYISLLLALQGFDSKSFLMHQNLECFSKELKYIEIYNFLRRLRAKKSSSKAYKLTLFSIQTWLESLPFSPTQDQLNALEDIRTDLSSSEAKRRVIMGDVGCGKTLVLLGAALMVYPRQALLMAPTSILAKQLYEEAKKLLPEFVRMIFLKGGKKEKDSTKHIQNANLIIGTHALLHLKKHNAVLVMIDEQHRFGSNQRQKIHSLSQGECSAHFIQFSATPIPRTLSMIQSELVQFSFIKQMPFQKQIATICIQNEDFARLKQEIDEQIKQNHQVVIVYPLVNQSDTLPYMSLEQASKYWISHYDKVFITHGKDKQKDEVLMRFRDEGTILLSTTVIEVGISLPRLSTIVIVGAERLGLATLHQLRGRVGRTGLKSTCYLYTKLKEIPQRLKEFASTLDGFKIAELDLKNRLSGDLLDGFMQHGNEFKFFNFSSDEDILKQAKKALQS
ncbi:ATP-dependent DNA helicase RecG [Campylobacter sp. MIT 21-1685]|uniref:ATP-dependent DNA helicase RecG n=1 Tax=unclassified Campylobacter TaxID=2593542 RepID=UPI00224B2079|nr:MULTISPECIES: ATP-dependent DNA helicase RecG [unclassified Campylobacter]MCX2682871.1 ATP-dependent DNA helicase RecG [Campylobacter sp. MIT 21-1684]MCX2751181.1 ATP-dependent DNA helicase RecG [Campylobacter sp. MIT 21-1682]MCX2807352.1 ATP-dependent DNA helicase RecG [Campylobacter sp. MIT 21-1685]